MLVEVGLQWELAREGVPIPTTAEGLKTVSSRALRVIWDAITEDARGKVEDTPKSSEASAAS